MAVRRAYGDSLTYWQTPYGGQEMKPIDMGVAKIVEPLKIESPETVANRERVTKNLMGKA